MILASFVGRIFYLWSIVSGKPEPVTLYDYPKFLQRMVLNSAAKEAGKKQQAVIDEYERGLIKN